jgi:hypothetical protein
MSSVRFTGPTCRGLATMYVLPLGYKREGTHTIANNLTRSQQVWNGTTHSRCRVLRSSDPNHSKHCVLVFFQLIRQSLGPLTILGSGPVHCATRPEDFPSDNIYHQRLSKIIPPTFVKTQDELKGHGAGGYYGPHHDRTIILEHVLGTSFGPGSRRGSI